MRTLALLWLAASVFQFGAFAQVPSIKEDAAFPLVPPASGWHKVIQNRGSSSIVALYATITCGRGGEIIDHDALLNYGQDRAIPPSGFLEIESGDPTKCTGGVQAAVFSDGHVEGTSQALNMIYLWRRGAYQALGDLIEALDGITSDEDKSLQVLLQSLQVRLDGIRDGTETGASIGFRRLPGNGKGKYASVYSKVKTLLGDPNGDLPVPSDYTPQKQPVVEQVMKIKNVSRDQARAIVFSKKLQEWRAALEGHLEPPPAK